MRIALASCDPFPPVPDDEEPLREALARRGAQVSEPAWDADDVDWADFDCCLIRTTWDYMERRDDYLRWAGEAAAATHLFHPPGVVAWNTHKSYLRELEAAGAPLADSVWLARGASPDLAELLAERSWKTGFVKPLVGATARNTLRFATEDVAAAERQVHSWLQSEAMVLQRYLSAVETEGELSVVMIDGQITHGVRKVPVPGDYRVQDDFGATDELWEPDAEACTLAEAIERSAREILHEDLLYARVDFLRDDGSLVLNELEVVEPQLFFRHSAAAAELLADALLNRLG